MSKLDEMIVVAPRSRLFADERLTFHGFQPLEHASSHEILEALGTFPTTARRGDVEEDPSLLQPIPYVVVTRDSAVGREVFTYTRLSGGGERRLHGRVSIGVGGHMNELFDQAGLGRVVQEEAGRELAEELSFHTSAGEPVLPPVPRLLGLINDDTGEVQRVHLGILAMVEVPADWRVEVRETERLEGSWVPLAQLRNEEARARLEEWSVHALAGIGG